MTGSAVWMSLVLALAEPASQDVRPSVAVMMVDAKQGVHPDVAEQFTSELGTELRGSQRFSRVVTAAEVRSLLRFEEQRQSVMCTETSCMAEVGGALGVTYLVAGSLGRVGSSWSVHLVLIDTRSATSVSSASQLISGEDAADMFRAVPGMIVRLLSSSPVPPPPGGVTPAPPKSPEPAPAAAATEPARWPGMLRNVGAGALVLGAVSGGLGTVAGVLAAAALGAQVVATQVYLPAAGALRRPSYVGAAGGAVLVVLGVVLGSVLGVAGVGSVVASAVAG